VPETVREKQKLEPEKQQAVPHTSQHAEVDLTPLYSLVCDGDDEELCVADMEEFRKEERRLAKESTRLEEMANRMKMRAERLREKAEMKRQQYAGERSNNNNKVP
jgi:hypothetical protein